MATNRPIISLDADIEDADWTKQSWDFPPYKSAEFLAQIGGPGQLDAFRKRSAYRMAVERGLIHDDEWVGDWAVPSNQEPA